MHEVTQVSQPLPDLVSPALSNPHKLQLIGGKMEHLRRTQMPTEQDFKYNFHLSLPHHILSSPTHQPCPPLLSRSLQQASHTPSHVSHGQPSHMGLSNILYSAHQAFHPPSHIPQRNVHHATPLPPFQKHNSLGTS